MLASVRALLHQIIDYAGLFPPAKLPLDVALQNYLRYKKQSPCAWMLGRFVCPVAKLPELLTLAKGHPDAALLQITALGQQSARWEDIFQGLCTDIHRIDEFRCTWGGDGGIDYLELALPKDERFDELTDQVPRWARELDDVALVGFLEVPSGDNWRRTVASLSAPLAVLPSDQAIGLKLRCGGLSVEAFPADEQVAYFIAQCRATKVPWKATAGLHHPRRHFDKSLGVWHHGILNVFLAGMLAMAHPLSDADLIGILADRDGAGFRFEEDRISWKDWSCTTAQITEFRTTGPTSFGSCSFDEPVDDLLAMGLLDRA
jgi:hypothetical protein